MPTIDENSDDRISITDAMILDRRRLIHDLAYLNDELERTSRMLSDSNRPPPPSEDDEDDMPRTESGLLTALQ